MFLRDKWQPALNTFLNNLSKEVLSKIPAKRALLYLCILGLLPFFFVTAGVISDYSNVNKASERVRLAGQQALVREAKFALNKNTIRHYSDTDKFYLQTQLEPLILLKPEIVALKATLDDQGMAAGTAIYGDMNKRLAFLKGSGNKIAFTDGTIQTADQFQETIESFSHPVEVDLTDLQHILALVEGVPMGGFVPGINRPHLIITDFKLDRKKVRGDHEAYLLSMKILRREYEEKANKEKANKGKAGQ